ncbi:MAG: VOC family protein [Polyangiales bacterium]
MSRFGTHLKLSVDRALRDRVRAFYVDGFGCTLRDGGDALDQFLFAQGESLGVFYIEAAEALPDAAWSVAPWLEFLVDDPDATAARLLAAGASPVEFMDRAHPYLRGPGGPVFRLAKG